MFRSTRRDTFVDTWAKSYGQNARVTAKRLNRQKARDQLRTRSKRVVREQRSEAYD